MATTLEQLTYELTQDAEGFNGQIHYDSKGIATLGSGVALIVYDSEANEGQKFSLPTSIGKVSLEEFLKLVTGQQNVTQLVSILEDDIRSLNQGNGHISSSSDFGINISPDFFISHIWGGEVGLYETYMNRSKSVLDNVNASIYPSLSDAEKAVMFSLTYTGAMGNNMARSLSHYISSDTEESFIGKMSAWYEILYQSNNNTQTSDRPGQQNRRFMEANTFLTGSLASKPTASTASSTFPVSNYNEANLAIAFMNCKAEEMLAFYKSGSFREYANRNYEIVRNHFSYAVSVFLSNQNYTQGYDINTLFTDWNLYTDLQIDLNSNGRPDGTTSYGNITGSDKRDLIFITGEQDGTTVHADAGNDFVGGSSKNDTVYSGNGDDVIYTYAGDDMVYTTDGKSSDYNQVYLGAGSDKFRGGNGDDFVDGGSGNINYSHVSSNIGGADAATDVNDIDLGGGENRYIGGIGKDKVKGTGYNTVFLGAGSDEYIGGDGVDIVDGGSSGTNYSSDGILDVNTVSLGGGNDRYMGGMGKDIVHGGSGDDRIYGNNGENELYGDAGSDHIYGGNDNDKLYGGSGRDYLYPGKGINTVDCGLDTHTDIVVINNDANGVDTIYHVSARDIISCGGGFNLSSLEQVGNDIVIYGNLGNKIILKDVKLPEQEEPNGENMPVLYQPDGTLLQWGEDGYSSGSTTFPPYSEEPENLDALPDLPRAGSSIPVIPADPEDGTIQQQNDKPLMFSGSVKYNIKELIDESRDKESPLVVDLNGDGQIETIGTDSGIYFDFDNNQKVENSGWIGRNDGFLVRDLNNNGQIDNGTELFGNHTVLQNGKNAVNGFEALKDLDSNGNGRFDAGDEAWNEVKVWRDFNTNGVVDIGEMQTLEQAGIESINLGYEYQKEQGENGNLEIQQGTFNRTDGTSGKVSDIWFDTDGTKTLLNEENITIPDSIKDLPNIEGWGNVYSLHAAMALDESGSLKSLVEQYMAATDESSKDSLLNNIIYHWTGVQNMDPEGRNPSQIYGNVLGDARKLEALEEFLGEEFLGTWCWGEREPNPHGQAAPMILQAFDLLKNYVGAVLSADVNNNPYLEKIILTYNAETKHWDVNVDQAVALLQAAFDADVTNGKIAMLQLSNILRFYDNADEVIAAFQAKGAAEGTFFETELLNFGHNSIGTSASDNLFGTDGNDFMNGLAGNDIIKAAKGDDTVLGGAGNDYIYGEDGDDVLSGEEGNDYLFGGDGNDVLIGGAGNDVLSGGNGADIYQFEKGFGNDSIDNTQDESEPNSDIIKFGEGILPQNATLNRQGYDLIISLSYGDGTSDSIRVFSYFNNQGTSSTTVSAIQFSDGTSWDYEYVLNHWNSMPDVNGGVTLEGNDENNTINGTSANDILVGNGGDDTISGNAGNDYIYGGTGNDYMSGGSGNDTYLWNLGDGLDTVYDSGNLDTIQFGEGIVWDYLTFQNSGNDLKILVHGQENQGIIIRDFFYNQNYKIEKINFFDGTSVNLSEIGLTLKQLNTGETIKGTEFDDIIYANGGNDTVNSGLGNDTIYGGSGFDSLYGEQGNDTLIGGTGNDYLSGGTGDDTYIYNIGDGLDTIYDYENNSSTGRNDKIKFGEGITASDVTFSRNEYNLVITLFNDITQGIIIQDFFRSDYYRVEKLEFADGTVTDLTGGLTLQQGDKHDNVTGTGFDDVIYGNGGNDTLSGSYGNDALIGGKGNDSLYGGEGDDTYIWNLGDGFDHIYDSSGNHSIEFGEGISLENLSFERSNNDDNTDGYDLYIFVNGDRNQGIHIEDFFHYWNNRNVTLKFADGSTYFPGTNGFELTLPEGQKTLNGFDYDDKLVGNGQNNTINGGSGNDHITGGKGNDNLYGGEGDETYIWNLGDGFDHIYDSSGSHSIEFGEGISLENLTFERSNNDDNTDGYDLYIFVNGDRNQGIHIEDFFRYWNNRNVTLKFADGSTYFPGTNGFELTLPEGQKTLNGFDYDDKLIGNDQNNTINGGSGNDHITGGKGNDSLYGGEGDDTYVWNLGDGFDHIYDSSGSHSIEFGEGITLENLTFERSNNDDNTGGYDLYIFVNGDRNQGIRIEDFFQYWNNRNVTLKFADGSTYFPGTNGFELTLPEGQKTLNGFDYDDKLIGNDQNNTINGSSGNDTLIGGKGDDNLYGGEGDDTYIWNLGDGFDHIYDSYGSNVIEFGEGISLENLTFERSNKDDSSDGYDLYIFVNGDRNQGIRIEDFFHYWSNRNVTLKFADGSTYFPGTNGFELTLPEGQKTLNGFDYDDKLVGNDQDNTISGNGGNDTLIGDKGNDNLYGGEGDDTYVWNLGDGFDHIYDSYGSNTIEFGEGVSLENLTFERSNNDNSSGGYDLYIFINGDRNQGIRIEDFFRYSSNRNFTLKFADGSTQALSTDLPLSQLPEVNLTLNGTADDDILTGGTGHDIINAGDGYNDITGGQGNDTITGGYDRDTYYYNLGDGFDTVTDPNGKDQIIFGEGISKDDLTLRRNGNDLWLIINNDLTQGMKLVNFFVSDDNKIETLKFADNSSINLATAGLTLDQWDTDDNISGTPYDDVIYGNDGRDTLSGGSGKDILIGGHGNDILYGGADNDTYRWNSGDGFDTIEDNSGQNSVEFGDGIDFDDLTFTKVGENLYITINDNPAEGLNLSKFFNSDSYKNFTLKFKDGTQHALNENGLVFSQGDTFDTINGTNFNDVIYANDGNDTINALAGNDTVYGGKGNDVIDAGNGNDTLVGGEGNDTLTGGVGDDTYIYNLGDGFDTISDTDGTDKIVLGTGITADMLSFSRESNDLRIIINNDKLQGFLLKNQFAAGTSKIESIEFADESTLSLINKGFTFNQNNIDETITGTAYDDVINAQRGNDTVNAGEGDDIITGGFGNDNLNGGNGDDTYIYNIGDGFDTITETSGADKIVLGNGITLENLRFIREGNNLRILIDNNINQGFLLVNQFAGADTRIEQLQFADNSILDLVNDSLTFEQYDGGENINGTDNDDTIYGKGGNDTINVGDGDDTIIGGTGDDTLSGGYGRDTYIYNLGDGADTINETRGNDIIKLGSGISLSDLTFTQEGNNLKIWIGNDPYQSILINNFYSNVNNQVEKLQFADGSIFNLSTQGLTLTQNNGDETINGTGYNDVIYGNGGHDTINAGEGNDTLIGGLGNDNLNGGKGDDIYVYNLGDGFDTIIETGGNDKIVFGEGISQSDLAFEQIGNNLKISVNGNEVKGIQINNHFQNDASKVETIEFHDGSTLDISNADQLIQAMNSFSISNSASTDTLSNPTQDVSDMYNLAASADIYKKSA